MFIVTDVSPVPRRARRRPRRAAPGGGGAGRAGRAGLARRRARRRRCPTSTRPRWPAAASWRCSPSARPRGPTRSAPRSPTACARVAWGSSASTPPPTPAPSWEEYGVARRGALRRPSRGPRPSTSTSTSPTRAPRHLEAAVALARRGLSLPRPPARRPRAAAGGRGPARHGRCPGRAARRSASPWRGASPKGAGRVFYTSLGHFPGAWETPAYLRHLQGGLAWVLGDDGD